MIGSRCDQILLCYQSVSEQGAKVSTSSWFSSGQIESDIVYENGKTVCSSYWNKGGGLVVEKFSNRKDVRERRAANPDVACQEFK